MMKLILLTILISVASVQASSQKTLQCERYKVEEGKKQERTIITLSFIPDKSVVVYEKKSGPDWVIPTNTNLTVLWKSKDNLRVVACWINEQYEVDEKVWHPTHVIDIDFGKPYIEADTFGGFSDFSTLVSSPWKYEFKRLD